MIGDNSKDSSRMHQFPIDVLTWIDRGQGELSMLSRCRRFGITEVVKIKLNDLQPCVIEVFYRESIQQATFGEVEKRSKCA